MAKNALLATGALAVAALGSQMSSAYGDHSWGNYHWARSINPVTVDLGNNVGEKWQSYLDTASVDWNESEVVQGEVVDGKTKPKNCKATDGRVEVCSESYGYNGWLGLAQIWTSGDHITKAIAKLNDSYFNLATYDQPKWRSYAMCHEVGHTFGLGHDNEIFDDPNNGSCLDYTDDPTKGGVYNLQPNDHDYEQLATIYSHTDEPTGTVTGPGKGGGRGPGKSVTGFEFATYVRDDFEDDWGRAVAFTSKGQPRLFVKDLGDGDKRITHVLWTEDAQAGRHFPRRSE